MSADVPPMSSVTTFSMPAARPAQIPPIRPATGPDISRFTGVSVADSTVAIPPGRLHQRDSVLDSPSRSASSNRAT